MLYNVLKKSKLFFSSSANAHRNKPEIQYDELKIFSKLNSYFKKHREIYKNKASIVTDKCELIEVKKLLFKKHSASGLEGSETPFQDNTPDFFLPNIKVFSLKTKYQLLAATKVYLEDNVAVRASNIIDMDLRELRAKGYKLAEMTPIAVSNDLVKDRNFNPDKNNLFASTILKTFSGIINYIYQFSDATHVVVLASNAEKYMYEWLGFKQFAKFSRTKNFPYTEVTPLVLDIEKMLSSSDKNISAYLTLINMDILKKVKEITYLEDDLIDYFEQYPSATVELNQLEQECLIDKYPRLRDIFYTRKIRIRHSASYRKETTQFTLSADEFKSILK